MPGDGELVDGDVVPLFIRQRKAGDFSLFLEYRIDIILLGVVVVSAR